MAAGDFIKFNTFVEALAEQGHKLDSDTLKMALSNTAPTAATDTVFDPVTKHPPPAAANGYTTGGHTVAQAASAQTGGVYKLTLTNPAAITATTGGIGPFRYAILYNDYSATDLLIGYFDYGSSITLASGETLTLDVDDAGGILTIT